MQGLFLMASLLSITCMTRSVADPAPDLVNTAEPSYRGIGGTGRQGYTDAVDGWGSISSALIKHSEGKRRTHSTHGSLQLNITPWASLTSVERVAAKTYSLALSLNGYRLPRPPKLNPTRDRMLVEI